MGIETFDMTTSRILSIPCGLTRHYSIMGVLALAVLVTSPALYAQSGYKELPARAWDTLNEAPGITFGPSSGQPLIQVVFDVNCPYSAIHYFHLQRYFSEETIRWVPVSYYKPDSHRRAKAILNAPEPVEALGQNFTEYDYSAQKGAYPVAEEEPLLQDWKDQALKSQWQEWLGATPLTVIRTPEGKILMHFGAVADRAWAVPYRMFLAQTKE